MAYPPIIPPATRTNATAQLDVHPGDHNQMAAALASIGWGRVAGVVNAGAAQSGIGATATDLTGLTVTVPLVVGRRYRASFTVQITQNTSAANVTVGLYDSANTRLNDTIVGLGMAGSGHLTAFAEFVAGATSRILTLRASTGAGTVTIVNGASPSYLVVDDVGLW